MQFFWLLFKEYDFPLCKSRTQVGWVIAGSGSAAFGYIPPLEFFPLNFFLTQKNSKSWMNVSNGGSRTRIFICLSIKTSLKIVLIAFDYIVAEVSYKIGQEYRVRRQ